MAHQIVGRRRGYVVEHRIGDETRPLGPLPDARPHSTALDPWASRLRREGETGELALIDETTGDVVARQSLERPKTWRLRARPRYLSQTLSVVSAREHLASSRTDYED